MPAANRCGVGERGPVGEPRGVEDHARRRARPGAARPRSRSPTRRGRRRGAAAHAVGQVVGVRGEVAREAAVAARVRHAGPGRRRPGPAPDRRRPPRVAGWPQHRAQVVLAPPAGDHHHPVAELASRSSATSAGRCPRPPRGPAERTPDRRVRCGPAIQLTRDVGPPIGRSAHAARTRSRTPGSRSRGMPGLATLLRPARAAAGTAARCRPGRGRCPRRRRSRRRWPRRPGRGPAHARPSCAGRRR